VGALPSLGHAQAAGAVTGRVTGPDGQPLSEVVVTVQGTGLAVATTLARCLLSVRLNASVPR